MIEKKSCWKQYGKAGQTLEMDRYDKETPDSYRSVYSELFSEFGVEVTRKIHSEYKGRQVSFPKKLYTEQYIDYYVKVNSASKSVSEMAVQLEYTERNIRQRLQKSQKASSNVINVNEETGKKIIMKYRPIYNELFIMFGEEITGRIYNLYKGHQISFPKKLYTEKYRDSFLRENIGNKKISELAAELGYTERRINQLLKKYKEKYIKDDLLGK